MRIPNDTTDSRGRRFFCQLILSSRTAQKGRQGASSKRGPWWNRRSVASRALHPLVLVLRRRKGTYVLPDSYCTADLLATYSPPKKLEGLRDC